MKILAILFLVCVIGGFAQLENEQLVKLREFKVACIAETGVAAVAVENAKKGILDEQDPKLACFASCFLKKIGFLRADDTFDEATFRALAPPQVPKEKVDDIINKCKSLRGANTCETGANILKCYLEHKTVSIIH